MSLLSLFDFIFQRWIGYILGSFGSSDIGSSRISTHLNPNAGVHLIIFWYLWYNSQVVHWHLLCSSLFTSKIVHILHYFRTCVYIDFSKLWRSRICDIQCVVCHISAVIWYLLFQISGQLFGSFPTQLSPRPKALHNKEVKPTQMLYLFRIFWDKFGHSWIG